MYTHKYNIQKLALQSSLLLTEITCYCRNCLGFPNTLVVSVFSPLLVLKHVLLNNSYCWLFWITVILYIKSECNC